MDIFVMMIIGSYFRWSFGL